MAKGSKALKTLNAYEKCRMQQVEECRTRLLESGILDISRSLTNSVDSKKNEKRKKKAKGSEKGNKDPDYSPESQLTGEEDEEEEGQSSIHAKATKKLEAMKSYQPAKDGSDPKDAFLGVMDKEYPGRRRLFGMGVTNKVLNKGAAAAGSYVVPHRIMDALRADMETEKTEIADTRKELEADCEQKKANLEADYAKKMEELKKSKESLVQEVLEKLIAKLLPTLSENA